MFGYEVLHYLQAQPFHKIALFDILSHLFCISDDRFVLKQISRLEFQFFKEFAPHYIMYIQQAHADQVRGIDSVQSCWSYRPLHHYAGRLATVGLLSNPRTALGTGYGFSFHLLLGKHMWNPNAGDSLFLLRVLGSIKYFMPCQNRRNSCVDMCWPFWFRYQCSSLFKI